MALLLALTGCTEGGVVYVSPPSLGAGSSLVFAVAEPGGPRFFAADLDTFTREQLPEGEGTRVEVFAYDVPLEALRIPKGPLTDSLTGTALPTPARRLRLSLSEAASPGWVELEGPSPLDTLRVDLISPCRSFDVVTTSLEPGRTLFLEPMPDGRLLHGRVAYGGASAELSVIELDGEIERVAEFTSPQPISARVLGEHVWMGSSAGQVSSAPLAELTRTSTLPPSPLPHIVRRLVARSVDGQPVITTLSGGGALQRFDGQTWTTLRETPESAESDQVGLLQLEDGEILAAVPHRRVVTRERDGVVADQPLAGSGAPLALGLIRGRPAVGLTRGELFVRQTDGDWQALVPPVRVDIQTFLDIEGGFLVGGGDSTIMEWNDELGGFCDPLPLEVGGSIEFLQPLGDVIVAAGRAVRGGIPLPLRFLRLRPG